MTARGGAPAAGQRRTVLDIVTPEGVPLHLAIASAGDRIAAFVWDLTILAIVVIVGILLIAVAAAIARASVLAVTPFIALWFFILRFTYFAWFELRWLGSTPGKRRTGLRVVSRERPRRGKRRAGRWPA